MPSTFTQNTGIEKIADGEQTGLWGDTTNLNLDIVDRALNGSVNIALSGTTHTLTTSSGLLSDGQFAVLVFTGSPSGTNTVTISPNTAQKTYLVRNTTAQSVVLTQGSGGSVTVPAGRSAAVYADGGGATAVVVDISAGLVPVLTNAGVTASTAELNILDGVTASTAELNILDGVTATTAELNILDGVTATTAELNILDGVTASTAELNILDGVTASTAELNILDGVTATTAELNILDGVTATTAELNFVDGVTSAIQTQLNAKAPTTRTITAGVGLTGGGDLSADRTIDGVTQTTATWEVGSSTTESLVSPAKLKAAVKPALNATGSAPVYACRAWVNFNGTGTVAIRASGNVSSITDNGTGDYTVNFTTAMPDADYSCVLQTTGLAAADGRRHAFVHGSQAGGATTKTASALRINTGATQTNSTSDMANISVSIFR
jgi:hypothetical protein